MPVHFFAWIRGTWYELLWRLLKCLFLWPIFLYIIENKREKVSSREGTIYTLFLTFSKYSRVPEQTKQRTTWLLSQSHIWVLQYLWNDVIFMPLAWWNFIVLNYLEHFISNLNSRFTRKRCLSCFFLYCSKGWWCNIYTCLSGIKWGQ